MGPGGYDWNKKTKIMKILGKMIGKLRCYNLISIKHKYILLTYFPLFNYISLCLVMFWV